MAALLRDSNRRCAARTGRGASRCALALSHAPHVRGTRPGRRARARRAVIVRGAAGCLGARGPTQRRNFLAAREPAAAPEVQRTRPPHSAKARNLAPQEPAIMKLLFLPALALGASRSFVDDAGVTHTTDKAAPTIVAAAGDALSLEPVRKSSRRLPRRRRNVCSCCELPTQCLISAQAISHGHAPCASGRHVRRALHLWV